VTASTVTDAAQTVIDAAEQLRHSGCVHHNSDAVIAANLIVDRVRHLSREHNDVERGRRTQIRPPWQHRGDGDDTLRSINPHDPSLSLPQSRVEQLLKIKSVFQGEFEEAQ
jgi:hypothetical protein